MAYRHGRSTSPQGWSDSVETETLPNDLESYWLPFTPNRDFKARPRLEIVRPGYALAMAGRSVTELLLTITGVSLFVATARSVTSSRQRKAVLPFGDAYSCFRLCKSKNENLVAKISSRFDQVRLASAAFRKSLTFLGRNLRYARCGPHAAGLRFLVARVQSWTPRRDNAF